MDVDIETPLVLVVDDEWLVREGTVELVEAAGLSAIAASSADEAIALLEARPDIRIVITDIEMPGSMDGLELVAVIRTRWPPVRLIVVSGLHDLDQRAIPSEIRLFGKPYSFTEMTSHLQSLLISP